ncbi:MAG TPA: hypothetical protein VFL04_00770 [Rectinemataceae bacterium]|nr:hypothetical protein [Rectinemataceae bacterium]
MRITTRFAPFAATLLLFLLLSCRGSGEGSVKLDPTPPISRGPGWAIVKEAYARLKERPSAASADKAHLRRGSVVELEGRELGLPGKDEDRGFWYALKAEGIEGFMRETELDVFSTRELAERAAVSYR